MRLNIIPLPLSVKCTAGVSTELKKTVYVTDDSFGDEEYSLVINGSNATITHKTPKGKHYGKITLAQIKEQFNGNVISCEIHDKPRYQYRGFMIDCARHFFSVSDLKKMIDMCAYFKFNKFHWHLTDDQGFRIELDKHPRLTQIGSVRESSDFGNTHRPESYGGYYTKDEIKEIIAYCDERFIDVIPEMDVPGHTTAIISSIPEISCTGEKIPLKTTSGIFKDTICVGKDKTYEVIFDTFDELCELFSYEYFHIGGDEVPKTVWKKCPDCQKRIKDNNLLDEEQLHTFFLNAVAAHLKERGKKCIVWNDGLKGGNLDKDITVQLWMEKDEHTKNFAQSGGKVIISDFFRYYADYPHAMTPLKKTYCFNPVTAKGFDGADESSVIGVETPIWTEYIETVSQMSRMCFPRFIAVAESGWSAEKNKNYNDFEMRLKGVLPEIKKAGLEFTPLDECNPNPVKRLKGTIDFAKRNISKDAVMGFFKPDKD